MSFRDVAKKVEADFLSSLVVFLVAIPLSLGIALASGVPPVLGLLSAVIGGIVVGALSGAPLAVSGPAAGLTVFVFSIVQDYGLEGLAVATLVCGMVQVLLSAARAGTLFLKFPLPVLEGMLGAIGAVILLGQLHVFLGQGVPNSPVDSIKGLWGAVESAHVMTAAIGAMTLGILFLWPKRGVFKEIPSVLPAAIIASLASLSFSGVARVGQIEVSADLHLHHLFGQPWEVWIAGLGLAVIASAESLLTARAVDVLKEERDHVHKDKPARLNKELFSQGVGNLACGAIGVLPVTAVIVRSAANVQSGAKTRASAILHGAWLVLFLLIFPQVIAAIPLAALAAILIATGFRLLNLKTWMKTWRESWVEGTSWTITVVAIIASDLLVGLGVGLGTHVILKSGEYLNEFSKFRRRRGL